MLLLFHYGFMWKFLYEHKKFHLVSDEDKEEIDQVVEILEEYLPPKLSDEDLDKLVAQAIQETAASSPADMGKVMQAVMKLAGAGADGKAVSEKVKSALS